MRIFVYPYKSASESAKLLADALDAKRIRLQNSTYTYKEGDLIVNWGNSNCPYPSLNSAEALKRSINKLSCFRYLRGQGFDAIPNYWTDPADIPSGAFPIFCRTEVEGHDGSGIKVAMCREELVPAKLYTSRVSGTEYRVTVFKGEVTDIQTKLPRSGVPTLSYDVKTYANGWGFRRAPVEKHVEEIITSLAADAINTLGLDFAGCDIVYDMMTQRAYLLEVNSAMGLEGGALDRFANAVLRYKRELEQQIAEATPAPETDPEMPEEDVVFMTVCAAMRDKNWMDVIRIAAFQLAKGN